ncbi:MAG: ACT domain-containing protein [Opitutales bacterium]|jgi:glycine cleavage system regulatory protein|nr:ACT domain-containing protein [Opitutales bacterium]MDP4643263.1 ACT domain-containing protein [Opitutales bacterium]MDP4694228.1 ACT domain-containing protein [Opitutales bacterium]MDP4879320.1 ACT domain-containing protein [Opitutales bacterium]MDP4884779.1 ACT domain-containing protein [Opitutales bacterium]
MESVLVLTISGADRSGLVETLAGVIAKYHGNWEQCRMAHLAGRFVGLLQVSVSGEQQQELEVALRTIKDLDVLIAVGEMGAPEPIRQFDLEVVGTDHPGIVRDVFKALAAANVNVEELSTSTVIAPDSGVILFEAKARLGCSPEVDREEIRIQLEKIAQDIMVDVRVLD